MSQGALFFFPFKRGMSNEASENPNATGGCNQTAWYPALFGYVIMCGRYAAARNDN